jgi:hypothetical protein
MIVGIHQPNYLPYLGFFDKLQRSDIFIIYDDAQFNKGDFQHRNRIRIYHGSKWLTVPVEKKNIPINEIKIRNDMLIGNNKWNLDHLKQIQDNYSKAPFYEKYRTHLAEIYLNNHESLLDLNMELILFLADALDVRKKIVYSSEFGFASASTEKIIDLVKAVDGDQYLSGPSGRDYLDVRQFEMNDIDLVYQDFKHPAYSQQYKGFIPNMTALDALLNIGNVVGKNVGIQT